MRRIVVHVILSVLCLSAQAQKVSNIRAEQSGQNILVKYSLETTSPCEVSLLLSQDNGVTWGLALKNVSGDVGKNISAGEKTITWKVLEEQNQLVGSKIKFKVISAGKKAMAPTDHEMVFVEGGVVQMGFNAGRAIVKPVYSANVGSFNIGKYEVSQAQWKTTMGNIPNHLGECDQCPIENVSWNEVQEFIVKLNSQSNKNYRLPTEAEWEYAAKGGKNSLGFTYSGSIDIDAVGWYYGNSGFEIHKVGLKLPNELGIHDMSGNVREMCFDLHSGNGQAVGFVMNPNPAVIYRVERGSCYYDMAKTCRPVYGFPLDPNLASKGSGFRLALPVE